MTETLTTPLAKGLAEYLESQEQRTAASGIIALRTTGSKPPLFLFHDISGLDLYCSMLLAHLDPEIPVYALPGVPLDRPPLHTIEGMATRAIQIMRETQAHGPYAIAGWSFGGVLAYEVAIQLLGEDEPVAFLGLIDAYEPSLWRETVALPGAAGEMSIEEALRLCAQTPLEAYAARLKAHYDALHAYAVHAISIPVHLYAAAESPTGAAAAPLRGWDAILPKDRIARTEIPGNHHTIATRPELGEALSRAVTLAHANPAQARKDANGDRCLTLQMGSAGRAPVFCIPGAGDNVVNFVSLSGALGATRPVYGLQPRGLDTLAEPHATVDASAAAYLPAILEAQPRGPLHLIGHSFGGWVAFELAARLRASGREVASLTLIDSEVPHQRCEFTSTGALREWIYAVEMAAEKSLDIDDATLDRLSTSAQLELLHGRLVKLGLMPAKSGPKTLLGPIRTFATALRASFLPAVPYDAPMRFVLVNDSTLDREASARRHEATVAGWKRFAPQIEPWEGPGNHITVLKMPHVQKVADWWNAANPR